MCDAIDHITTITSIICKSVSVISSYRNILLHRNYTHDTKNRLTSYLVQYSCNTSKNNYKLKYEYEFVWECAANGLSTDKIDIIGGPRRFEDGEH